MELIFNQSKPGRRGVHLPVCDVPVVESAIPQNLCRQKPAKLPEVSELDTIRHFIRLSRLNFSVDTHFYPLGSCTMKYNPKINERLSGLPGFTELHPLMAQLHNGGRLTQGALHVLYETERLLSDLLGFAQTTLQPMAGANGELTGVMMMTAYHKSRNDLKRTIMLIPDAAHGTNPASAAVAGLTCKTVPSNDDGDVDLNALKTILSEIGDQVCGLMLTCPNTMGLFDSNVVEITKIIHEAGGLAYCDGANLNAILGRIRPGDLGFDVMHTNLHKTFSTPHGGGGPGSGPVAVCAKLVPFLPISRIVKDSDGLYNLEYNAPLSIGYISPFYGNFAIILRAYIYILMCGRQGVKRISENAVLNANYIRARLAPFYDQKVDRHCMHECVFSATRQTKNGVHALDIAKALLDAGFHAPTIYFPLIAPEALMIEPTETESKEMMDEFCDAMIDFAKTAEINPEKLNLCPVTMTVKRIDETTAARDPFLASLN